MLPWFSGGAFPLYLAPMAGYTDVVFRQLCKEQGADVMVTEFVLADSLLHGARKAWAMVDFTPSQRPMGVQIFGSSPEVMAEAARRIEALHRPDFIDLNFGCPADRITDMNAGSSLLKDPPLLGRIAGAVVRAVPGTPVTGKVRTGWDEDSIVALEVGRILQDEGVRAVAVHGRTKVQGYRGEANWDVILEVAAALDIPVIGNGSVNTCQDVVRLRAAGVLSGLMVGRAALGYPWLFREIKHYLATGQVPPPPTLEERLDTLRRFADLLLERAAKLGGRPDLRRHRSKLLKLTKGIPGCKQLRQGLSGVVTRDDLARLAERHRTAFAQAEVRSMATA